MDITVKVTLPDDLTDLDSSKVSRDVLEQIAVEGYKDGRLSAKHVRLLLGFDSRMETEDFLHRNEAMEYTVEDLERDLEAMAKLGIV